MKLDERGIPTEMAEGGHYSKHCPPSPCQLCTGNSDLLHEAEPRKMTSWEWCQHFDTCAATVEWDAIAGH